MFEKLWFMWIYLFGIFEAVLLGFNLADNDNEGAARAGIFLAFWVVFTLYTGLVALHRANRNRMFKQMTEDMLERMESVFRRPPQVVNTKKVTKKKASK